MKKTCLVLTLAIGLLSSVAYGQGSNSPSNQAEGIVVLKGNNPRVPSIVTDMKGAFVFTRYDLQGNPVLSLEQYNAASGKWTAAPQSSTLSAVMGKTDPDLVSIGRMLLSVYWKDASGQLWCLHMPGTKLKQPSDLEKIWAGNQEAVQAEGAGGSTIWLTKTPVLLRY